MGEEGGRPAPGGGGSPRESGRQWAAEAVAGGRSPAPQQRPTGAAGEPPRGDRSAAGLCLASPAPAELGPAAGGVPGLRRAQGEAGPESLLSPRNLLSNPFNCNCHLAWLGRWLRRRRVVSGNPRCQKPSFLKEIPIQDVAIQDFTCDGERPGQGLCGGEGGESRKREAGTGLCPPPCPLSWPAGPTPDLVCTAAFCSPAWSSSEPP